MTEIGRGPVVWFVAVLLLAGGGSGPQQVSQSGKGAYEASLQTIERGFVVAWHDYRDGNAEIYARVLGVEGRAAGPEVRLTHSPALSFEADVAVAGDGTDLIAAWYEHPRHEPLEAWIGRSTQSGESLWQRQLSTSGRQGRNPLVRVSGHALFCAWVEESDGETAVWAQWFNMVGESLGERTRLGPASETTWNLNAALHPNGRVSVVYDAIAGTKAEELFVVEVDWPDASRPAKVTRVRLTEDDGFASKYPDIDMEVETGRVALTWFDERDGNREVYLAVVSPEALMSGLSEAQQVRVTDTPDESLGAYLAWNGDRLGLAWSDEVGGQHEIFFALYDPSGRSLGTPQRLTANPTASLIPAIARSGDGFALAWNEDVIEDRGTHETGGNSEVVFSLIH